MQLTTLAVLFASLSAVLAAPANLEPRQTYIITCIGGRCTDNISRPTSAPPQPTTSKLTTTTKKPDPPKSTSKPEPPKTSSKPVPAPTPTKTTIKSSKTPASPTKTTSIETGPSSTACPVPNFYKCGGWDYDKPWEGCTVCVKGSVCVIQNEWYYQCVKEDSITTEIIAYE